MAKKLRNNSIISTYIGLPKEIYILFLGKMINCIGAFVNPLLALILTQKIGFSPAEAGLFITCTCIFQAPCVLIGGKLTDSLGRKKTMVIFQSLAALTYVICGFIEPSHTLAIFLVAAGCFSCVAQPAYDSLVGDITNPDNRQASFSLVYIGLNLGFAIGPLIGGMLYQNYLPIVFIGDAFTTFISILLIVFFIKEPKKASNINTNSLEAAESGSTLNVFLKRPILIYFALITLLFHFVSSQWSFAIPLQLATLFGDGIGAKYFGMLASCNAIVVVLFTPLLTLLTRKFRILSVMALGGLLYALSLGSCGFISNLFLFFIVIFFVTIGEILISINASTFITNITPASHRGRVNATLPLIYGIGGSIGPSVMGIMITNVGLKNAWLMIGIVGIVGATLMYSLNLMKITTHFKR